MPQLFICRPSTHVDAYVVSSFDLGHDYIFTYDVFEVYQSYLLGAFHRLD